MFYDLVKKIIFNSFNKKMTGGAEVSQYSNLSLFFIMIGLFIIKVLLVMISYNIVVPRILEKWGKNPEDFRPLSFVECVFIIILFNNLFNRF